MTGLSGRAAIVGVGATEFAKDSGRSELRLAAEAVRAAVADAGLRPHDVDGLVTFTQGTNPEAAVAREVGIPELTCFSRVHYGGGAARAIVQQATMAVASGVDASWSYPMWLSTRAGWVAMIARRYMHEYGAGSEDFGRVAVADRKHAATNPNAYFYRKPITLAEHQASRWIVEPPHLLDCCQESDGGVAVVVTSAERARDLPHPPAVVRAAAQNSGTDEFTMTSYYYRDGLTGLPEMGIGGEQFWRQAGLAPEDVEVAVLYDHFTPFVLIQLVELGFCPRGEARHFVADGGLELDGRLPTNPHGGQLGEAYIHGMNGIAEPVRQVRGSAVNQVADVQHVLVTAGTGVPTSGLVLGAA